MSLHAHAVPDIPEDTAQIAKAVFRKGNSYMTMRDELGTFFTDDQFVDLYPADGQPAFSPWRLALVCVRRRSTSHGLSIGSMKFRVLKRV